MFAKFPGAETAFAGSNAFIVAAGGLMSSILGGYISDRLANPDPKLKQNTSAPAVAAYSPSTAVSFPLARAWVPAIGSLLAVPAWTLFIHAETPEKAAACLLVEYLVAECWFGPTLAAGSSVVHPFAQ